MSTETTWPPGTKFSWGTRSVWYRVKSIHGQVARVDQRAYTSTIGLDFPPPEGGWENIEDLVNIVSASQNSRFIAIPPEEVEETEASSAPDPPPDPDSPMSAIQCLWGAGGDDPYAQCKREGDFVVRFRTLPCGHPPDRGLTQYYCQYHIARRSLKHIFYTDERECEECGETYIPVDYVISTERL